MLLRNEVTQASDIELLTVILGKRGTAETLLQKAGGSLFTLFFAMPQEGRDMSCAQGSKGLRGRSDREAASCARTRRACDRGGLGRPGLPFESPSRARPAQAEAGGTSSRGFRLPATRRTAPRNCHRGTFPRDAHADQRLSPRSREGRAAGKRRRRHLCSQPPLGRRGAEPRRRNPYALAEVRPRPGGRSGARPLHRRGHARHEFCGKRTPLTPAHRRAPRALPCATRPRQSRRARDTDATRRQQRQAVFL